MYKSRADASLSCVGGTKCRFAHSTREHGYPAEARVHIPACRLGSHHIHNGRKKSPPYRKEALYHTHDGGAAALHRRELPIV